MKFDILNRFTDAVQFTCELDCAADTLPTIKLGMAVKLAVKEHADLRNADLRGADLRGTYLSGADLRGADLSGADLRGAYLSGADLSNADLSGAYLSGTYLSGADLSGAYLRNAYLRGASLSGVPKIENIHQAVFAAASRDGALNMGSWHQDGNVCGTTHCRAGWVVSLAGPGGHALEWAMGTPAAAAIIYIASDPTLERIPDFYCGNEAALTDMKQLAELEAAGLSKGVTQ